ncbi:MAG TPA: hypothetical protein VFN35_25885 [Ktedonobacteraceae bacterium]|nr:hypothetical protein [Ktedonobacteraceae bacterium]
MPITRRKRANPPDQPENNHHQAVDQTEGAVEQPPQAEPAPASPPAESVESVENPPATASTGETQASPENPPPAAFTPTESVQTPLPASNGDRSGSEYTPPIEGGRRTPRGELFRRPPQMPPQPPQPQASFVSSSPLQAPTHEITLPLGNLLHLAYNPGYTGSEEARSLLLHRLTEESKSGGRARCWNCGSLAIAYDRWNTRSRSFGEVGVAFCEICGVWSVM